MNSDLKEQQCEACEGIGQTLTSEQVGHLCSQISAHWKILNNTSIKRDFTFKNFYETMAFVNAIAWMAHHENHHPDLQVGYNYCTVEYSTHALKGLTHNDFICAAKVDRIIEC